MDNVKFIADKVNTYLKEKKIKQKDISSLTGIPLSCVTQLLAGNRPFTADTAMKFFRSFGFSYKFLLTGEGMVRLRKTDEYFNCNEPFQVYDYLGNRISNGSLVVSDLYSTSSNLYIFMWADGQTPGVFSLVNGFIPCDISADEPILEDYYLCDGVEFCKLYARDTLFLCLPNGYTQSLVDVKSPTFEEMGLGINTKGLSIDVLNMFKGIKKTKDGFLNMIIWKGCRYIYDYDVLTLPDNRQFGRYKSYINDKFSYILYEKDTHKVFANFIFYDFPELHSVKYIDDSDTAKSFKIISDYHNCFNLDGSHCPNNSIKFCPFG